MSKTKNLLGSRFDLLIDYALLANYTILYVKWQANRNACAFLEINYFLNDL